MLLCMVLPVIIKWQPMAFNINDKGILWLMLSHHIKHVCYVAWNNEENVFNVVNSREN